MTDIVKFSKERRILFTADTHFGHRNIIRYCNRPFYSVEEMDETLINNWNKVVDKEDVVFHLGDFAVGGATSWSNLLQRLNGKVYLIMGNHDVHTIDKGFEGFQYVSWEMLIEIGKQKIYLNHYPFLCFSGAKKNTWQLFGHVHTSPYFKGKDSSRLSLLFPTQYDVGVDNNNFTPISYNEVKAQILQQLKMGYGQSI